MSLFFHLLPSQTPSTPSFLPRLASFSSSGSRSRPTDRPSSASNASTLAFSTGTATAGELTRRDQSNTRHIVLKELREDLHPPPCLRQGVIHLFLISTLLSHTDRGCRRRVGFLSQRASFPARRCCNPITTRHLGSQGHPKECHCGSWTHPGERS